MSRILTLIRVRIQQPEDSAADWQVLVTMGGGAKIGALAWNVVEYDDALKLRNLFRALVEGPFSLLDLICLACLGKSLPAPPPPDSTL